MLLEIRIIAQTVRRILKVIAMNDNTEGLFGLFYIDREFNDVLATLVLIVVSIVATILLYSLLGDFTFDMVITSSVIGIVVGIICGALFGTKPSESIPEWIEYEEQIVTEDLDLKGVNTNETLD